MAGHNRSGLAPDREPDRSAISSTWRSPITRRPEGNPPAIPDVSMPGLPSGRRVIALWEVDEIARTRTLPPHYRHRPALPTISETCPPGEGIALVRAACWS